MNKLKKLGFKKVPGTGPGFHMFELTPATLQAASSKLQASSNKRQAVAVTSCKLRATRNYEN